MKTKFFLTLQTAKEGESMANLNFRQLQYGRCDLLIVTNNKGDGVIIPRTKFLGRKLVPILVNKNNISEFAATWTGLRKSLFADSKISDFKGWLTDHLTGVVTDDDGNPIRDEKGNTTPKCPAKEEGCLQFDELSTIYVKKDVTFDPATFRDYFFTDPKHTSAAQYRGEKHTAEKIFPTARGSAWLFNTLRSSKYGIEVSSFNFGD
jgi:hypothetical protein